MFISTYNYQSALSHLKFEVILRLNKNVCILYCLYCKNIVLNITDTNIFNPIFRSVQLRYLH